jgi:hypothetical protein
MEGAAHIFFSPAARRWLQVWMERTGVAIATRQAAVRESYEKARYSNLQDLREKKGSVKYYELDILVLDNYMTQLLIQNLNHHNAVLILICCSNDI